jgi:hypothetical protein
MKLFLSFLDGKNTTRHLLKREFNQAYTSVLLKSNPKTTKHAKSAGLRGR